MLFSLSISCEAVRSWRIFSCIKPCVMLRKVLRVKLNTSSCVPRTCFKSNCHVSALSWQRTNWRNTKSTESCSLFCLNLRLLLITTKATIPITKIIAIKPPQWLIVAIRKLTIKAAPAVINQPPITVITPVMR